MEQSQTFSVFQHNSHFTFYVFVIFYIVRWYDFFFLFISYLDSDMKLGLGLIISPLNVLRRLFIFCRQTTANCYCAVVEDGEQEIKEDIIDIYADPKLLYNYNIHNKVD